MFCSARKLMDTTRVRLINAPWSPLPYDLPRVTAKWHDEECSCGGDTPLAPVMGVSMAFCGKRAPVQSGQALQSVCRRFGESSESRGITRETSTTVFFNHPAEPQALYPVMGTAKIMWGSCGTPYYL
jgi:hypothetical protein